MDGLRAFAVFAETLNFTHAAERLHLSQPALHVKIAELAKNLGRPLYIRQGRRLELTCKGHELAAFALEMNQRVGTFLDVFQERDQARPLVVAAGEGAYLYLMGPALKAYAGPLQLLTTRAAETLEAIRSGHAHLGVGSFAPPAEGVQLSPLCRVGQVLVIPAGHRLARQRSVRLKQLNGMALIVPPSDRPQRQTLSAYLQGVEWTVAMEASGWPLVLHFVKLGLGAAIVNSFCPLPRGFVGRPLPELPEIVYEMALPRGYVRPEALKLAQVLASKVST